MFHRVGERIMTNIVKQAGQPVELNFSIFDRLVGIRPQIIENQTCDVTHTDRMGKAGIICTGKNQVGQS